MGHKLVCPLVEDVECRAPCSSVHDVQLNVLLRP